MNKAGRLFVLFIFALLSCVSAGAALADDYVYVTTNMTWAEFYAGELGASSSDIAVSYDAVSTATQRFATRFGAFNATLSGDGTVFEGVKDVQVRMTSDVYNALTDASRFGAPINGSFNEYKEMDADGNFGAMITETVEADSVDVAISGGKAQGHGNYRITLTGLSYDVLGVTLGTSNDNFLGVKLETTDGTVYGLKPLHNLWIRGNMAEQIGFSVEDFVERNGTHLSYAHTQSLPGKTISTITYMLKNQPDIVINCGLFVKNWSDAAVTVSGDVKSGSNVSVPLAFSDIPDGAGYELASVAKVEGRTSTVLSPDEYDYDDETLTFTTLEPGSYTATFTSDTYVDIVASINAYVFATTDMTWEEFYAAEINNTSADLLDAISSPTARVANRFTQLTSESNDIGGRSITGVKAVQVRFDGTAYAALSDDERFTFVDEVFTEYKPVNSDGSFGKMVTETHVREGATVTLTSPGTWGDYVLAVSSIDVTVSSGDEYYYLGALVETSDGSVYGMRHNNNLWFSAKDLAISTAEFVEVHGVSRSYAYTADMEGKTITKITYMLKNMPDEIVSCDVFLKLKTDATVAPEYETGWHAVMAGYNVEVPLVFSNVPTSADYSLSGVTFGTGRNRKAVSDCTMSGDVLIIAGEVSEGTYTATFVDQTYANIAATIQVYTTNVADKIISADKNLAGLMFLLTPAGVCDSTDEVLDAQNFVNATEWTKIDDNATSTYSAGLEGSGFTLEVKLSDDLPSDKMGILGFSNAFSITRQTIGSSDFVALSAKILALPDVAYGWRVPTGEQLKDMGLTVVGLYPDGVSRDITDYVSSGLLPTTESIMMSYGTVLIDRAFTESEEGKVYQLSEEGEGTMSDGLKDKKITATWYVRYSANSTPSPDDDKKDKESDDHHIDPTVPTVKPSAPSTAMTTEAKQSEVKAKLASLSSKVTADTQVQFGLPDSALKGDQSVSSPEDDTVYLPVIEVDEAKVYIFGVSLDSFVPYDPIYWSSNAVDVTTGEFVSAADAEEAAMFFDSNGNETNVVPSDRFVNVAAYLEPGYTYSPTITTVQVPDQTGVSSSSGGCNGEVTLVGAMMMSLLFIYTRRRQ